MNKQSEFSLNKTSLLVQSLKLSKLLSYLALTFPVLTAIGWGFRISLLTKGDHALPAMHTNDALFFSIAVLGILLITQCRGLPKRSKWSFVMGTIVFLSGAFGLAQNLFSWNFQIFEMSLQTSFNFILLGVGISLYSLATLFMRVGQFCSLLVCGNSVISITGYIFSTSRFYGFPVYEPALGMPINFSITFLLLGIALITSQPTLGIMSLLTGSTRSGYMARNIMQSTILLPPLIGGLTLIGTMAGWYEINFQISLFFALVFGLMLRKTWSVARQAEQDEKRANMALKTAEQALEDLKLAEAKSTGILSISADAIISLDEDQNITMFNIGAEKIFSYSQIEVLGKPLDILIPERYRESHRKYVKAFSQTGFSARKMGERNLPIYGLRKNGEEFPADAAISKLEVGGKSVLTVALRDISIQHRFEMDQQFLVEVGQVLASSLDYDHTLDNILKLSVRDLAEYCIVYSIEENGDLRRSHAVSRDPAKDWVCKQILSTPFDKTLANPISHAIKTRQSILVEKVNDDMINSVCVRQDHLLSIRALDLKSFMMVPLLANGKLIGAIVLLSTSKAKSFNSNDLHLSEEFAKRAALALENSRLYREEQRARLIANSVPVMIAYWDKNQRCQFANRAYTEWFKLSPDQLIGKTLLELLGPTLYEQNLPHISKALNGLPQSFERALKSHSTGEVHHKSLSYIPEIVNGNVNGFFVLITDVTQLKNAQIEAMSEKEKALAAVKTREEILVVVSHDLKNPLTTIDLVSQMLQRLDRPDNKTLKDLSQKIKNSVNRMQLLIGDLLDFAKIQSGTFSVSLEVETLSELVNSVLAGYKIQAEAKNLNLSLDIPPDLPKILADGHRISQVISNLLGNAIKFTPSYGSVSIKARSSNGHITISVSDTGIGISEKNLKHVFDRFWQADRNRNGGSGLGLSIAKGIVSAHNGQIWVDSTEGKGSTFHFTVPTAAVGRSLRSQSDWSAGRQSKDLDIPSLDGVHVLLVDDSIEIQLLVGRFLADAGAKVSSASSASEALSLINSSHPDVVVTDIEMPEESGYELIQKINQLKSEGKLGTIPVIAMTGHNNAAELDKIDAAGFDLHLIKPMQLEQIVSAVKTVASNSRLLH